MRVLEWIIANRRPVILNVRLLNQPPFLDAMPFKSFHCYPKPYRGKDAKKLKHYKNIQEAATKIEQYINERIKSCNQDYLVILNNEISDKMKIPLDIVQETLCKNTGDSGVTLQISDYRIEP